MHVTPEALFLIQSAIFIAVPFLLWQMKLVRSFVPLVVIQILLGVALGPSLLGRVAPDAFSSFYPPESLKAFSGLAWLGLALFGFLAGLHFDMDYVRKRGAAFFVTSISTLVIPLLAGVALACVFLSKNMLPAGVNSGVFILGIATAISVTALPVLSALLFELKLTDKPLGQRVLGYAVVNDILLWVIVAVLTSYSSSASSGNHLGVFLKTAGLTMLFVLIMATVVRKLAQYAVRRGFLTSTPTSAQVAVVVAGVLICGFVTESIGIHYLFGAFALGTLIPKTVSHGLYASLEKFTMLILLPFFFILTGLKTSFSIDSSEVWVVFGLATLVAIASKLLGTIVPELIAQKSTPQIAIKAGMLMQTKGLMEVIILNLLLAAGIISSTVFSGLILMAVATTILTKPMLKLIDVLPQRQKIA